MSNATKDQLVSRAADVLALTREGRPRCSDSARVYEAIVAVHRLGDDSVSGELLTDGFLRHSDERRARWVEEQLTTVSGTTFCMGTPEHHRRHFCGEDPAHSVAIDSVRVSQLAVTNGIWAAYHVDPAPDARSCHLPVTDVTWFDAWVFAAWMGCRLLTEAEWEYCAGAGTGEDWCCPPEELHRYAWYSENAGGELHEVGRHWPNALGLYDMHGNVWEWCEDTYGDAFYAECDLFNPVNTEVHGSLDATHKVSRGGGYLALPEMCRHRYRLHDPAAYSAPDTGFRLASTIPRVERNPTT